MCGTHCDHQIFLDLNKQMEQIGREIEVPAVPKWSATGMSPKTVKRVSVLADPNVRHFNVLVYNTKICQ